MTRQGYLCLGGVHIDAFEDWRLIFAATREEPADYELDKRSMWINGPSTRRWVEVDPEKHRELFDYVLERGA